MSTYFILFRFLANPPCVILCQENFDLLYSSMDTNSNGKIDFEEVRISIFPFLFTKE